MIKNFVKNILFKSGYIVNKSPNMKWKIEIINRKCELKTNDIISNILYFSNEIDMFYNNINIREELKINGSWKHDQRIRRQNLIKNLKDRNKTNLSNLFENMFFNEIVEGVWCYQHYKEKNKEFMIGDFVKDYLEFKTIYPKETIMSFDTNLPHWGYKLVDTGLFIKPMDLWHTYQTILIEIGIKNLFEKDNYKKKYNIIEIGSGWGGLAYNLFKKNLFNNIILVDIPINLISAYYFLTTAFSTKKVEIVDSAKKALHLLEKSKDKIILIPSCFFDLIKNSKYESIVVNFGSFPIMEMNTINHYINNLPPKLKLLIQINSNLNVTNGDNHIENKLDDYSYPQELKQIFSGPSLLSSHSGGRYKISIHKKI